MTRRQAKKCVTRAFQRGGPRYRHTTWQRVLRTMLRHGLMYDIATKQWGRLEPDQRQGGKSDRLR